MIVETLKYFSSDARFLSYQYACIRMLPALARISVLWYS